MLNPSSAMQSEKLETQAENFSIGKQRISFEQSFEVVKNDVEGMPAVSKKSARIVGRFVAVERNLNGADLTLR